MLGDGTVLTMRAARCFRKEQKGRCSDEESRVQWYVDLNVEQSMSKRCERWASEVKCGSRLLFHSLVELKAVSCTPVVERGRHEYQAAAACLIQLKSHARLQTTKQEL